MKTVPGIRTIGRRRLGKLLLEDDQDDHTLLFHVSKYFSIITNANYVTQLTVVKPIINFSCIRSRFKVLCEDTKWLDLVAQSRTFVKYIF